MEMVTTCKCYSMSFLDSADLGRKQPFLILRTLTILVRKDSEPDCSSLCGQDVGQVRQAGSSQETEPFQVSQRELILGNWLCGW